MRSARRILAVALGVPLVFPTPLSGQGQAPITVRNDSLIVRFVNAELQAGVQALGRYLDRPITFGTLNDARVTLETPQPVPREAAVTLLRGMLENQNYELVADSSLYRVRQRGGAGAGATAIGTVSEQAGGAIQLWVIRLRHARAADVAATVNALYGRASALGELGGRPSTLGDQLRQNRLPSGEMPSDQPLSLTAGRTAALSGEVTIVPDAGTNSLLVRASQRDFDLITAAIEQLDIRPLQVLIEVLIAEVRRDRSYALGLDLGLDTTRLPSSTGAAVSGTATGLGLGDFVLHVMNLGGVDLNATLRAAAGRGDVSIVSRPVILAANNETAEIVVGSQRPFVQVSRSLPTDVPTRDQVVQYRDVGTRLTVHPTISGDGYVMLEITQEVNAATTETAFNAPVISTRSIQTRLLVRDSQTVVLGGLTDRQRDSSKRGIPVLSEIPLIGGLFGSSSWQTTGTELLLFVTPRVIRTDEDLEELTDPLKVRAEEIKS